MSKSILSLLFVLLATFAIGCTNGEEDSPLDPQSDVGVAAPALLSSEEFRSLTVEIHSVAGAEPTTEGLAKFEDLLWLHLDKPDGIEFVQAGTIDPALVKTRYTADDIANIEDNVRLEYPNGSKFTIILLFLNGSAAEDKPGYLPTLGYAYRSGSIAIFSDAVRANSGGWGQLPRRTLEATVLGHEFGHLLGLVNNTTAPQSAHEDAEHPHHCSNPKCLMNWQAATSAYSSSYGPETVPPFDSACLEDLRASGGL